MNAILERTKMALNSAVRFALGPWQPRIPYVAAFVGVTQLYQVGAPPLPIMAARGSDFGATATGLSILASIPLSLVRAIVTVGIIWLALIIVRRVTGRQVLTRGSYLVFVALGAALTAAARIVFFGVQEAGEPTIFMASFLRAFLLGLILFGFLGALERRFSEQARRADEAVLQMESQRIAVVEAQEHARQSIARLLHDRVQAAITAVSLQLVQARAEQQPIVGQRIDEACARLEHIRSTDVRSAAQQLSPDLTVLGLAGSLATLARNYGPAMVVTVDDRVDEGRWHAVDPEGAVQLAAYRIIEQAVLDAAVHGRATRVGVSLVLVDDFLTVTVMDDGRGMPESPQPGTGTAVIDSWVGIIGGAWSREAGDGRGVVVRARLRVKAPPTL